MNLFDLKPFLLLKQFQKQLDSMLQSEAESSLTNTSGPGVL